MRIWIKKDNIEWGQRRQHNNCPIARRLKELTQKTVSVERYLVHIGNKSFRLHNSAKNFVRAFDYYEDVKPCYVSIEGLTKADL